MFDDEPSTKILRIIGIAAAFIVGAWILAYFIRDAQNKADMKMLESVFTQVTAEISQASKDAAEARARREATTREARARQLAAQADKQRLTQARQNAQTQADAAKERAWSAHYKPPQKCLSPGDDWSAQVECANDHMRARRAFDAAYVP